MDNNHDELDLFLQEMGDVTPLKTDDKVHLHDVEQQLAAKQARASTQVASNKSLNPLSMEGVKPIAPDAFLSYQKPGIQDGVFKNLRLGKYPLEYRLSLKGLLLNEACDAFYRTLQRCHEKGTRALLIQHGTGEHSKPFPAARKSYVKHWLDQMDEVIAYHTAQRQHGGLAATYVLLKKHPEQKLINREKNKRG